MPAGDTIYFAMTQQNNVNVEYTATTFDGNTTYTKTLTNKAYEEGHFYALGLRMTPVAPASPEQQQDAEKQDYTSEEW